MSSILVKGLLIIGMSMAISAYLLTPHKPVSLPYLAGGQHSNVLCPTPLGQIGARNHSGREPYDVFGFCRSEQGRDYDGGRDLLNDGR
jgi:hypothetical protein